MFTTYPMSSVVFSPFSGSISTQIIDITFQFFNALFELCDALIGRSNSRTRLGGLLLVVLVESL